MYQNLALKYSLYYPIKLKANYTKHHMSFQKMIIRFVYYLLSKQYLQ